MPVKVRRTSSPRAARASRARQSTRTGGRASVAWPSAVFEDRRGKLTTEDAYDVGRLIVEELYRGDRPEHGGRGRTTFRKISEEMNGRMSAQALYRCAAIYEMCRDLKLKPKWAHLGMSHLSLLLGLADPQKRRLLREAETGRWSVERLRLATGELRGRGTAGGARRGRKPLPRFARAVGQLERFLDGREELTGDLAAAANLDRERVKDLLAKVTAVQKQLTSVQKGLTKAARAR